MNVNQYISALAQYGINRGLIEDCDRTWAINQLIDALGRRVRSVRGQQTVNTADLPAGLYLLRVAGNGRQAPSIHKIIIKH